MKLYRTAQGGALETDAGRYELPGLDWDALFRQADPGAWLRRMVERGAAVPLPSQRTQERPLAPIGSQEVWAAGVTYYRSRTARMEEAAAAGGGDFYDRVYAADAARVVLQGRAAPRGRAGAGGPHPPRCPLERARAGTDALRLGGRPHLRLHDRQRHEQPRHRRREPALPARRPRSTTVAARLGPCILLADGPLPRRNRHRAEHHRAGRVVFSGATRLEQMKRTPQELVEYLFRAEQLSGRLSPVDRHGHRPAQRLHARRGRPRGDCHRRHRRTGKPRGVIMPLHGKNIIGRSLSAEGTRSIRVVNPATGQDLEPPFFDATPQEVARALELAGRGVSARTVAIRPRTRRCWNASPTASRPWATN